MTLEQDKTKELTPEQELFCRAYTDENSETFSSGVLSYAKAYGYDLASRDTKREIDEKGNELKGTSEYDRAYNTCASGASQNLRMDNIRERVNALMLKLFNDDVVSDKRLTQIIIKGKDTDTINAIKHRNDLKQRITKKLDITTAGRPLAGLSDEELLKIAGE